MGTMSEAKDNNNTMSDDRALSQTRKKNINNNGTGRQANRSMKGKSLANKQQHRAKMEAAGTGMDRVNNSLESAGDSLPLNGHMTDADSAADPRCRSKFIKQESQASSSGATAADNGNVSYLNDSLITNESSLLTNQSCMTSLSVGGQTDKSVGADSTASKQSVQSSSEIKAKGVELLCKFYAKQPSDKKKCLLRDCAITINGEVLITDSRNKNVKVFSLSGELTRMIEHPELRDPFGVAAMPGARFIVADCKSKDLKIFSLDGSLLSTIGHNFEDYPMKEPRGVAINSKGEIIISDSARRCVYIYQMEGSFCDVIWGEAGLKPLQFKNPAYVGVTEDDDIIVSDYYSKKIAVFDAHTHDLKFTYGTKKDDRKLRYPRGVATDMDGNIMIADNYNGKVHYITSDEGGFIRYVYGDKHGIHRPRSVATDQIGHMVIIENGGRVRVFDTSDMSNADESPSEEVEAQELENIKPEEDNEDENESTEKLET